MTEGTSEGRRLILSDEEMAMHGMQSELTIDESGRLAFVGLTVEESIWLIEHRRDWRVERQLGQKPRPEDVRRHGFLSDRLSLAGTRMRHVKAELRALWEIQDRSRGS